MDKRSSKVNSGYVTVEYAIVTAAVIIALLAPIPGLAGGDSMTDIIMDAIREFQAHSTTMLAMP